MSMIKQINDTLTPVILGAGSAIAQRSLLEQLYAIVLWRLLLGDSGTIPALDDKSFDADRVDKKMQQLSSLTALDGRSLLEQLWSDGSRQKLLFEQFAQSYHLSVNAVEQLVIKTLPLLCQQLIQMAQASDLSLLQMAASQQQKIRSHIPAWSAPLLAAKAKQAAPIVHNYQAAQRKAKPINRAPPITQQAAHSNPSTQKKVAAVPAHEAALSADNLQVSPVDYRSEAEAKVKGSGSLSPLVIILPVVMVLLLAIVGWFGYQGYQNRQEARLQAAQTAAAAMAEQQAPVEQVQSATVPASITIKMDLAESLYQCQGSVGSQALQVQVMQVFEQVFAQQSAQCQIAINTDAATQLSVLPELPMLVALVKSVPFSTFQLQGNTLTLSAPDPTMLQELVADIQAAAPSLTIDTIMPLAIDTPNTANTASMGDIGNDDVSYNIGNERVSDESSEPYNQYNQAPIIQSPPPPVAASPSRSYESDEPSSDNYSNDEVGNNTNNGGMSAEQIDRLVNQQIVAEPALGGRPLEPIE